MRRFIGVAALAASLVAGAAVAEEADPVDIEGQFGILRRVVSPAYPAAAFDRHLSGRLVVTGIVAADETMPEPTIVPEKPQDAVFIESLREVIGYWRWHVVLDKRCQHLPAKVTTHVDYEWDARKPRIYVTQPPAPWARTRAERPDMTPIEKVPLRYPPGMLSEQKEARVYALMTIDPDGTVSEVTTTSLANHSRGKFFESSARRTLAMWKFPKAPEAFPGERKGCMTVDYLLVP